jgi:hypothetical protein
VPESSNTHIGDDFSQHQVYAAAGDPDEARRRLLLHLRRVLHQAGCDEVAAEADADRSFVVGPAARWVQIGDSAGSTETADPQVFADLAAALSTLAPVIDVDMSDSAAVHFYLYRDARRVDQFGNAAFPFYAFTNPNDAAFYRGCPDLWADLLVRPDDVERLRDAWVQMWGASEILATTGDLFGWDPRLSWCGYTFDAEGVPEKWDRFLQGSGVDLGAFTELHFRRRDAG